jgi:hypothetical protein
MTIINSPAVTLFIRFLDKIAEVVNGDANESPALKFEGSLIPKRGSAQVDGVGRVSKAPESDTWIVTGQGANDAALLDGILDAGAKFIRLADDILAGGDGVKGGKVKEEIRSQARIVLTDVLAYEGLSEDDYLELLHAFIMAQGAPRGLTQVPVLLDPSRPVHVEVRVLLTNPENVSNFMTEFPKAEAMPIDKPPMPFEQFYREWQVEQIKVEEKKQELRAEKDEEKRQKNIRKYTAMLDSLKAKGSKVVNQ